MLYQRILKSGGQVTEDDLRAMAKAAYDELLVELCTRQRSEPYDADVHSDCNMVLIDHYQRLVSHGRLAPLLDDEERRLTEIGWEKQRIADLRQVVGMLQDGARTKLNENYIDDLLLRHGFEPNDRSRRMTNALKFIASVDDVEMFKGSQVHFGKIEDQRIRSALTVTLGWSEIAAAVVAQRAFLESPAEAKGTASSQEATEPAVTQLDVGIGAGPRSPLGSNAAKSKNYRDSVKPDTTVAPASASATIVASAAAGRPKEEASAPTPPGERLAADRPIEKVVSDAMEEVGKSTMPSLPTPAEPQKIPSSPNEAHIAVGVRDMRKARLADTFARKSRRQGSRADDLLRDAVRQRAEDRKGTHGLPAAASPPVENEPEYIRVDREFAQAELAEGRNVDGKRLKIWREQMTRADTPFYRGETDEFLLAVENDLEWIEPLKKSVNVALTDEQIVRYLSLMVPLLPPVSQCEGEAVTLAIIPQRDDEASHVAYLKAAMDMWASQRSG